MSEDERLMRRAMLAANDFLAHAAPDFKQDARVIASVVHDLCLALKASNTRAVRVESALHSEIKAREAMLAEVEMRG